MSEQDSNEPKFVDYLTWWRDLHPITGGQGVRGAGQTAPIAPVDTISYCTLGNLAEQIERSMPGDVIRVLPEVDATQGGDGVALFSASHPIFGVMTADDDQEKEVYREETHPSEFRLLHKRTGAYVLQGGFKSYRNGDLCAIKWRDFPTVEEEPEKPKNAWAQPQTKWGGRV